MRNSKRVVAFLTLCLTGLYGSHVSQGSSPGVIALIGAGVAAGSADSSNVTTASYDTTGASLIVISTSILFTLGVTPTDSKGNTWTPLTSYGNATGNVVQKLYYCVNPTVGTGHTFSLATIGGLPSLAVLAFSTGSILDPGMDAGFSPTTAVTSVQPGSLTPSKVNSLMVTGLTYGTSGGAISSLVIDSGFVSPAQAFVARSISNLGTGLTYLIETTAVAKNPTWSWTSSAFPAVSQAVFRVATGGDVGDVAAKSWVKQ